MQLDIRLPRSGCDPLPDHARFVSLSEAGAPIVLVAGLAMEARIGAGPGVICVAAGGDQGSAPDGSRIERLRAALDRQVSSHARALISFGLAGGLAADLETGTWLVGRAVIAASAGAWKRYETTPAWTRSLAERLPGAQVVDIAGSDAIVPGPRAKEALREASGASAVDMESHVVAAAAAARGLPFAVFRVVADSAHRPLPPAARTALGAGGRLDWPALLRSLAGEPGQALLLVRTAIEALRAMRALWRGRRRLGPGLACPDLGELELDVP